jgi:hypothetical protein
MFSKKTFQTAVLMGNASKFIESCNKIVTAIGRGQIYLLLNH